MAATHTHLPKEHIISRAKLKPRVNIASFNITGFNILDNTKTAQHHEICNPIISNSERPHTKQSCNKPNTKTISVIC